MTNVLAAQEWLPVIREEYLGGLVMDGGSAVKFAVPATQDLRRLVADRLAHEAADLDYFVARIDSGGTRVHMPQEIFFAVAQQIDWRLFARRVLLRLAREAHYPTDSIDPRQEPSVVRALAEANDVDESTVAIELRPSLERAVFRNSRMSRDFRIAMTGLCHIEMAGREDSAPLVDWLTGANRRISNVRSYAIYNTINRTNAKRFLQSLLYFVGFVGHTGTVLLMDISRVPLRSNPRDNLAFYTRPAAMDHYELLRELIDGTDRLPGLLLVVMGDDGFLDDDPRGKGFVIYQALRARISDEVRSRSQANPMSSLVRLADTAA